MFESIGEIRELHDLINLTEILSIPVLFEFFKLFIVSDTSWAVDGKKKPWNYNSFQSGSQ